MRIVPGDAQDVNPHLFAGSALEAFISMKDIVKMFVPLQPILTLIPMNARHVALIIVLHAQVITVTVVKVSTTSIMEHAPTPALMELTSLIISMALIAEHVPSNARPATTSTTARPAPMDTFSRTEDASTIALRLIISIWDQMNAFNVEPTVSYA